MNRIRHTPARAMQQLYDQAAERLHLPPDEFVETRGRQGGVMSATVEQLASQIQVLLDDAYRRGVQQGLRVAADAVQQLIPDPPSTDGEVPPDDRDTTVMQQAAE